IGVDYRINDDILTYITYSEGFRSGGFNGRNQDPANIGPFDPEYVNNYELGFKSDLLDQTLRVNLAAFYNEYDDKQEEVIESDGFGGSNTVVRNAATVQIIGLEGELTWVANEYVLVNANFGYLDAEYDEYDADLTGDGIITDNSDLELRRVPEWTAGLNTTFTLPVGPGDLSLYMSYRYTDEYYVEVSNDPRGLLDSRGVFDATLAYDWQCGENSSARVALFGRDMTDEVDYNSAVIIPGTLAFGAVAGGEQYGVRVNFEF
ncbi:MAG: TonB-dependent receptor, partial [Halioglobus sp.]|nr:TonB-dependent receptor [Halioglobus sp.]